MLLSRRLSRVYAIIAVFCFSGSLGIAAEIKPRPRLNSLVAIESNQFPLVLRSVEAVENPMRLADCEKALSRIAAILGSEEIQNLRFVINWDDRKTNASWLDTFPRTLSRDGKNWVFTIQGQGKWQTGKEQLYRTLAVCFLQSLMLAKVEELPVPSLPEPPLWLSEGVTQVLMDSRREDFGAAVWRFSLADKVPPLSVVEAWPELAEDGIKRRWQQTFAFWLVIQATKTDAEKKTLRAYLSTVLKEPEKPYWSRESFNEEWWQQSANRALKERLPLYDWDQSSARLREATMIPVRYVGDEEERLISIIELPKSPESLQSLKPLDEIFQKLVELELRGHPLLKGVAASYRVALQSWSRGNIDEYARNLRAARDQQKQITLLRSEATDFLDWFTVNYAIDSDHSDYRDYALRVEELEGCRKKLREETLSGRGKN